MKQALLGMSFAAAVAVTNMASAQQPDHCTGLGGTRVTQVSQLVGGNTMCATRVAAGKTDRWQAFHQGNGNSGTLIDYRRGPNHPTDPTEPVGTWSATNGSNSSLTSNYGTGGTYIWTVCSVGGTYTVTGPGGTISGITIIPNQVSCGFP